MVTVCYRFLVFRLPRQLCYSSCYGDSYVVNGRALQRQARGIFDDTRGTILLRSSFGNGRTRPRAFRVKYVSDKVRSLVDIRFFDNPGTRTEIVLSPRKRGETWISLGHGDARGVADPIAATIILASSLDNVCGRTVRIYNGELRADLSLTAVSKRKMSVCGFTGHTVI